MALPDWLHGIAIRIIDRSNGPNQPVCHPVPVFCSVTTQLTPLSLGGRLFCVATQVGRAASPTNGAVSSHNS